MCFEVILFGLLFLNQLTLADECNKQQNIADTTDVTKNYYVAKDVADEWIPCLGNRNTISMEELSKIQNSIWSNVLYRNETPEGDCFSRSELLAFELDQVGIQTRQLILAGPMLATLKVGNLYQSIYFDIHAVVSIQVVQADGSVIEMVLDPEFTDGPLPLNDYLKEISPKATTATGQTQTITALSFSPDFDSTTCKDVIDEMDEWSIRKINLDFHLNPCPKPKGKIGDCSFSQGTLDLLQSNIMDSIKNPKTDLTNRTGFPTRARSQNAYTLLYGFQLDPDLVTDQLREDVLSAIRREPPSKRKVLRQRWLDYLGTIKNK